jgi:hypothetical protein
MRLDIRPMWDPGDSVRLTLCDQRRELVVAADGEVVQYLLRDHRPDRLGWVERRLEDGLVRRRRVTVGEVVCACLREWEAEQLVLELSRSAARRALRRGGAWRPAGERLAHQARSARGRGRVSALPFQVLFRHRRDPAREQPLSGNLAAERIGFTADGAPDSTRLLRRLGLADQCCEHTGERRRQRAVGYRTGLALCEAIGVDPVELGL